MKISFITLFPNIIKTYMQESIMKRASEKNLISFDCVNPRDFTNDNYHTVDDNPYGGGAGMVMKVEPLLKAIYHIRSQGCMRIFITSARGTIYNQEKAYEISKSYEYIGLIAGHYEGYDERIFSYIDEEISIGDYILTGGELPALSIADSIIRLVPNVLARSESTQEESFFFVSIEELLKILNNDEFLLSLKNKGLKNLPLLEYPQYTRPISFDEKNVPEILLSGHHKKIKEWRLIQAYNITKKRRPNLFQKAF